MFNKKLFFIFYLLIIPLVYIFSDTIYVYIEKGDLFKEEESRIKELIFSIESGIMESFFDNGHIVFSDNSAENQINDYEKLNQLAKYGGANILFTAVLNLDRDDEKIIISGDFSVYNLFKDEIIYSGEYSDYDDISLPPGKVEDMIFLAGKTIGNRVLKVLF